MSHQPKINITDLMDQSTAICCVIKTESEDDLATTEIESDDSASKESDSSSSSSGSWSIDDNIEYVQMPHKPSIDELPTFSIGNISPNGRSLSPICNESISLFNLSISPISSVEDLAQANDKLDIYPDNKSIENDKYIKDWAANSYTDAYEYPEDERISLDEIQAQINTPPSAQSKSNKRLNLETIFEDVFFETPKKKRLNEIVRFNSWRIETFREITNEERINSYLLEQQQNCDGQSSCPDGTNHLCDEFDDKVKLCDKNEDCT